MSEQAIAANDTTSGALAALEALLGDRVTTSMAVREHHGRGEDYFKPVPSDAVCFPQTTEEVAEIVQGLVRAGVPVLGHVGLTPQTASQLGGYKLQGRRPEEAERILKGALALEEAGAYGVVLEMVPARLAKEVTERLSVHTVGIGAGPHTDAQVLVFHDVVGLYGDFKPRFVKRYLEAGRLIQEALSRYAQEVREGVFPGEEHSF